MVIQYQQNGGQQMRAINLGVVVEAAWGGPSALSHTDQQAFVNQLGYLLAG
jgi:hypothetical protein